jgi:transglutaminase-like putative cysteine protease
MQIKIGYDISLKLAIPSAVLYTLYIHPSREKDLVAPENFRIEPDLPIEIYQDLHGNKCGRLFAPAGLLRFTSSAVISDSGLPDVHEPNAIQHPVQELPIDVLPYVLPSRYCDSDSRLLDLAWNHFGATPLGWARVQAICDFVHRHLRFDYQKARANRTASDAFKERVGVCRDFTHLAIAFCRCMNIPARYATGYLGDIGVPKDPSPMDFSAWFEVYLGGRWYTFDARHNVRRIGRIVMARGRDASDVALTTVFGANTLAHFEVFTDEIPE